MKWFLFIVAALVAICLFTTDTRAGGHHGGHFGGGVVVNSFGLVPGHTVPLRVNNGFIHAQAFPVFPAIAPVSSFNFHPANSVFVNRSHGSAFQGNRSHGQFQNRSFRRFDNRSRGQSHGHGGRVFVNQSGVLIFR